MSTVPDRPDAPPPAPTAPHRPWTWPRAVCGGAALLLAGTPVAVVVEGRAAWAHAAAAVALVVLVGIAARRTGALAVAALQLTALTGAVTAVFADSGALRVLPGPAAAAELTALGSQAAEQIRTGVPPVPPTAAMLLLVAVAFGIAAVAVDAVSVGVGAPAAAGVPLLAVFAVPTALADELLPAWMPAVAAAGFGLLLLAGTGARRHRWHRAASGVGLTAVAVALALGVGSAAGGVGTAGRPAGTAAGTGGGQIGLSPFTSLRGQLQQSTPAELFRVRGLSRPAYLRALTLSTYVPDSGWQPSRPGPGVPLTDGLPAPDVAGERVSVQMENLGFRDYWLPVYGLPLGVEGVADDRWAYDPVSGTAYSTRPRQEDGWTQEALLPVPTAADLRAADGAGGDAVDPAFLATAGVDPRVAALAAEVTADAPTRFDRAVALTRWFTGPTSAFTYDLSTAPGNGDDALVEFLTQGRRGYCEQFASAMAVMLRTVGVPARVAVGFTAGRAADDGRAVSTTDAHAWVEAWFPGVGWTTFDPTPLTDGRALVPPHVAEAATESDAAATPSAAAGAPPSPEPVPAAPDPAAPDPATPGAPDADGAGGGAPGPAGAPPAASWLPPALLVPAFCALAAAGAAPALWRARLRRRNLAAAAAGGPGAATAAWAELLAESTDRGVPGADTDTVRSGADRMAAAHRLDDEARRALRTVVGVVESSWYGGVEPPPGALTGPVRTVRDAIAAGTPLPVRDRLLPPAVRALLPRVGARSRRDAAGNLGTGAAGGAGPEIDDAAARRR